MTIFSPAAKHFFVHASAPAFAPFAPHLLSLTHPLTVVLFPMSSNANAVRANTKQIARQSTITFLMAGFSPFDFPIAALAAGYGRPLIRHPASNHAHRSLNNVPNYTTEKTLRCHADVGSNQVGVRADPASLLRRMIGWRGIRWRRRYIHILAGA